MKSPDDDLDLATELRALRPTPRPEFTAELDARAAAGFPGRRPGGVSSLGARIKATADGVASRFRIEPRKLLAPAGAGGLVAIVIATAVVIGSEGGMETTAHDPSGASSNPSKPPTLDTFSAEMPKATAEALQAHDAAASAAAGRSAAKGAATTLPGDQTANHNASGPYATQTDRRAVERSAEMTLGTDPTDVRRAAGKVFETVHAYDGIVLSSSIEDGGEGEAGASFDLLIPSGKLGDALASFSSIAEVRSRHEATADVTAKTVGLGERLQDGRATVESLLAQLAAADTEAERAAAEAELRSERLRVAGLRARLADLQRRANLSQVSLKIETGEAGTAPTDSNGSWGIGDALADAGHILEVAAGIALIGLAILSPIALLCLLAWLGRRTSLRRGRERALS